MADERRDVHADATALEERKVLGERLELPAHTRLQRFEGHALDVGQVAHREVAVAGTAGSEGESAVAQDGRGDPQGGGRREMRIPRDLRVVVRVVVDDAWSQREAARVDAFPGLPEMAPHTANHAVRDGDVCREAGSAGAVHDQGVFNDEIVHVFHSECLQRVFAGAGVYNPLMRTTTGCLILISLLACWGPSAPAGEKGPPSPARTDAAEKVQEGNVKQWVEYYERTRPGNTPASSPQPPKPAVPATNEKPDSRDR
ncbi:MAG: hypothetical protein IPK20_12175 [Betaproteobacteria bacterium]|nr:hypothetical protein [Betaproteobacteria bacterium]